MTLEIMLDGRVQAVEFIVNAGGLVYFKTSETRTMLEDEFFARLSDSI